MSHRLSEIFDVADHYTVLRDGAFVGSGSLADVDRASLIHMIVGREISEEYAKINTPTDEEGLSVAGLTSPGKIADVSFTVRKGEIFGIYGLMGSGRTEIFDCLFGLDRPSRGDVTLFGKPISIATPAQAMDEGIALVTEDRKLSGLNLSDTTRRNITLASLRELSPNYIINGAREAQASKETIERFRIRVDRDVDPVSSLSGGNQQKVVLGKWFVRRPRVLLLDEPTRGVDVGAKREISRIIGEFAAGGGTVAMISSEIEQIVGIADRIMVMRDGRSVGNSRSTREHGGETGQPFRVAPHAGFERNRDGLHSQPILARLRSSRRSSGSRANTASISPLSFSSSRCLSPTSISLRRATYRTSCCRRRSTASWRSG